MNCCGCINFPIIGEDGIKRGCIIDVFAGQGKELEYVVPQTGNYAIYLGSNGHNLNEVIKRQQGTEMSLIYLERGQIIRYFLGDDSYFILPNGHKTTTTKGSTTNTARFAAQYLGLFNANVSTTTTGFSSNFPRRFIPVIGFEPVAIIPQPSDISHTNARERFSYFAKGVLEVVQPGDYTFYSMADDYGEVWIDGMDVIRRGDENKDSRGVFEKSYRSTLTFAMSNTVNLTQGSHDVFLWNINTLCCGIHNVLVVKYPDGTYKTFGPDIPMDYIRGDLDCLPNNLNNV